MIQLRDKVKLEQVISTGSYTAPVELKGRVYRGSTEIITGNAGELSTAQSTQLLILPGPKLKQGDKITHDGRVFYVQGEMITHHVKGRAHHCTCRLQTSG